MDTIWVPFPKLGHFFSIFDPSLNLIARLLGYDEAKVSTGFIILVNSDLANFVNVQLLYCFLVSLAILSL